MTKERLIPLKESELAQLIRLAEGGLCLAIAFGTGGAALQANKSPWAVPHLEQWRGITVNDGAGI